MMLNAEKWWNIWTRSDVLIMQCMERILEMGSRLTSLARALLVGAFALVAVAGCSTARMGYTHLDTIALWTADRYFDLDEQQSRVFRARFRRLHEWHRYEQLPDYANFLAQTKTRFERGLTAEDANWFIAGLQQRYAIIVERGVDDAAAILLTITPQQIEVLQTRFDKLNQRFAGEYEIASSIEDQRRATLQRTLENCRDWFGSLSVSQEALIRDSVGRMEMIGPLRQQDRMRRQREFLVLMQQRGEPAVFREKLRDWLIHWEAGRSPEYQRAFARSRDERIALLVALDRTLTSHQRTMAAGRIQDYIDDFKALSSPPGAHAAGPQSESASSKQ